MFKRIENDALQMINGGYSSQSTADSGAVATPKPPRNDDYNVTNGVAIKVKVVGGK